MGIDAGFDMVPCLSTSKVDKQSWAKFINFVKDNYKDDVHVEIKPNYILFKVGEHPSLPFEGHKLLRFSSEVSGSSQAQGYIDTVGRFARTHFGSRVQYWHEASDSYGKYGWAEVHESIKSYEKVDEPEDSAIIESLPKADIPVSDTDMPIFEVKDIPGKGRGLLARVEIPMGTQIFCEQPLLTGRPLHPREMETYLAAGLKALPKQEQRLFLSLQNNYPGKFPFSHTFKTNALPCGPDSPIGAVYPTICFINHSCIPNVHHSWDTKAKHETIYAIRPIAAGEEITIMYDSGGPFDMRRAFLRESFSFDCNCRACSCQPSLIKESDVRRRSIQSLDEAIGDPYCLMSRPAESLKNCQSLLQVLKDEYEGYAGVLNARVYYDAFQICVAHGDQARASAFAQKSYQMRVICEGEDSPETQSVKHLASKPSAHSTSNVYSQKWRTNKTMVPKNLAGARLDEWLFARAN
ncbi:hypothetical protein HBI25_098300 [Parastagonospora nodorum]|nr:hypothetical protein HBH43_223350 [Parastagonospora nodorum]KAH4187712.1 hypothetical protein HBI95_233710 [Parastagonospora nodorum]KAH4250952.1 hypothetical protein HBI03_232950 [Parastagonospora nodorum]KAH4261211.1 hypothetical protein HBI04_205040 [Parastagonospora nodorum]KAH5008216.1 hypothetical protein HBI75_217940 [Parastagonospora nodorum]